MAAATTVWPVQERDPAPATASDPAATRIQIDDAVASARRVFLNELQSRHDHLRWAALRASSTLDTRWLAEAARPLASSPDVLERVLALEVIAQVDPELGREDFLAALSCNDRAVRLRGLQGLERLADPRTAPEIARLLEREHDPDLRASAARALGVLGDPAAIPALYTAIDDDHMAVRRQAVNALVTIGDTNVGRYLISLLGREGPRKASATLQLLAQVGDPELIPTIAPYLQHPHDPIRLWAATAILASGGDRDDDPNR